MEFSTLLDMIQTFDSEDKCIEHFEKLRWPDGVVCPQCGSNRKCYKFHNRKIYKCGDCKKQFSIRVGTIFEGSPIPLGKWFMTIWLITSHKKGISSNQLRKDIGVTQKTAWFMLQRLREVSKKMTKSGRLSGLVEIDDTYIGGKEKNKHANKRTPLTQGRSTKIKTRVLGFAQRDGIVKAFRIKNLTGRTVEVIIRKHIERGTGLVTDEFLARFNTRSMDEHQRVNAFLSGISGIKLTYSELTKNDN